MGDENPIQRKGGKLGWLTELDVAHRGLHLPGTAREENSLAAISAAVEKGYAVLVDIRSTLDGVAVAFHDATLDRMTEKKGKLADYSYRQLEDVTVGWSQENIPSLTDVLDVVEGQVPVFLQIKTDGVADIVPICAGIRRALEGYKGKIAVMSFDFRIVSWFKRYLPTCGRGVMLGRDMILSMRNRIALNFKLNGLSPDFVAFDVNLMPNPFAEKLRKKGMPIFVWTVRHVDMESIARRFSDRLIFEEPAVTGVISDPSQ